MTIHERALEATKSEAKYVGSPCYSTKTYLHAFLNDAELVEKVAANIHEEWMESESLEAYEDWENVFDKEYWRQKAKAALETIKKEAGI